MWILKPDERLREWHSFRKKIGQLPVDQACNETVHLWSYAPYVTHYLDTLTGPNDWPDPWTLLYENYYCDLAKSLGMLYTLYLSDHKSHDMELIIATDNENRERYNLVSLSKGKYILNFAFDAVVNKKQLPKTIKVNYTYTVQDLRLDIY